MDSELVTTLTLAFDSRLFSSGCFLACSVMGIVQNFDRRSLVFFLRLPIWSSGEEEFTLKQSVAVERNDEHHTFFLCK
jgi:hypothetical protein